MSAWRGDELSSRNAYCAKNRTEITHHGGYKEHEGQKNMFHYFVIFGSLVLQNILKLR
jgi:hypothetical protein